MKKLYAVLTVCLILTLTGCSSGNSDSDNDSSTISVNSEGVESSVVSSSGKSTVSSGGNPSVSSSGSSNDTSISEPASSLEFLVGLAGDVIPAENFITDMTGITRKNFTSCMVKGTYVAMPNGIFRTSLDNPDVFDKENNRFTDIPEEKKKDFILVEDGDEICGLKVKKAVSQFTVDGAMKPYQLPDETWKTGAELGFPEIYFNHGELELEGSVEMTGYISIVAENVYGVNVGDILFIPTDCKPALPILYYVFEPSEGFYHNVGNCFMDGDIVYTHEYGCGCFRLGNKSAASADLSGIPDDGSFVKAKVVVKNISMSSTIDWFTKVSGELASVQVN